MKTIISNTISFYGDINNFKAIKLLKETLGEIIDLDMLSSDFSEDGGYNTITVEFLDGHNADNKEFSLFLNKLKELGAKKICTDDVSYVEDED